ncbi:MAG: MFS transporter [Anaerolineales bacterium]
MRSNPSSDRSVGQPAAPTTSSSRWILLTTILASSMAFIDSSAFNVTLPAIQADLGATGKQLLWIVNAYLLFLSALLLLGGSLGDRYGRKKVLALGIIVFTSGSLAAGLSASSGFLVGTRAIQGIGGALMVPGSLSIITASVPAQDRGAAIGTWSAFTTVATILGPVLGGFLASAGLWRVVFFINLPLAVVALAGLAKRVPESRDPEAKHLDVLGALLVTLSLAGLTYGAIEAPESGITHPWVLIALAGGVVGLLGFIDWEWRTSSPLLPLRLFGSRTFSGTNLLTLLLYAALNIALFFFSLTLIQGQGYRASEAGLAILPFTFMLALLSRWSGDLADRHGPRPLLVVGPLIAGIGFFGLGLPGPGNGPSQYWTTYFPWIMAVGIGMGLTVAPLTTAVMSSVREGRAGTASGINNAIARVGGVLAVAIVGGMALLSFRQTLAVRSQSIPITAGQHQQLMAAADRFGETTPPASVKGANREEIELAIHQSLLKTLNGTSKVAAGLAILGALLAGWFVEGKRMLASES